MIHKTFINGLLYYDISDHLPIFTISRSEFIKNKSKTKCKMSRKETKQNIELLNVDLAQENWSDVINESDINASYEHFLQKLLYYYNKNIPLVKINNRRKAKQPWITKGIMKSISTRNKLYRDAIKSQCNDKLNKYKTYRNYLTFIIRLSRKLYYSNNIEQNKSNVNSLWKTVNGLLGKKKSENPTSFLINDQQITDPQDISNAFNDYYINIGPNLASSIDPGPTKFTDSLPPPCDNSIFFNPTNDYEIINIVKHLNSTKSSGHDGISVHLLKQIIYNISVPLTYIFNLSLLTGMCPNSLKIAKVIPIYKKDDSSLINNYRPISLLPSISKILEKLVYKRLYSFLQNNNILIPNQFGFRQGHSTEYAILHMYDKIIEAFSNNEHIIGIFMDLSKAFDTIDHKILIHKLQHYGIRGRALSWFINYLQDRQQYVSFQSHESHKLNIKSGVPQGSILGPLLFIIYINDIVNSAPLLNFIVFADDTSISFSHKNIETLITQLNSELLKISRWFKSNKLSLNVSKTNYIYFKKTNVHEEININIEIDGLLLIEKQSLKCLGVTIDSHLTWQEHISNVHTSISRNIGILYKLKNYLSERSLVILYNSLILSHILYCNILWGNCNINRINSLLLLQKRAVRIITNSNFLSHTQPIFYRLKTLKIQDIHTLHTGIFMYKYSQNQLPSLFRNIYNLNSNIHTYPTRRSSDYHLENPKIILAQKSIRHNGPDIWNTLPTHLRQCSSLFSFKALFKKELLSKYQHV